MTRAAFGIALVICGSLTLAAQDSGKPEMKTIYLTAPVLAATCPIDMFASQNIWNHTIAVQKGRNEKFGQRITLTLRDSHPDRIVAGTVRVQGLTGKNHVVQTGPAQNGDSARTLKVSFAERSDGSGYWSIRGSMARGPTVQWSTPKVTCGWRSSWRASSDATVRTGRWSGWSTCRRRFPRAPASAVRISMCCT